MARIIRAQNSRPTDGRSEAARAAVRWDRLFGVAVFEPACRRSSQRRSMFQQERPQDGTVATRFVCTVTAYGEIGIVREGRKEEEKPRRFGALHFGPVSPGEGLPGPVIRSGEGLLDQALRWRQVRKPYVVEITGRMLSLRHAARRAAHGPQAQPLAAGSRAPQSDYSNGHSRHLPRPALAMTPNNG